MMSNTERNKALEGAATRVRKYLDEYSKMSRLDPEEIASLHVGDERQASLSYSDLRVLVEAAAAPSPVAQPQDEREAFTEWAQVKYRNADEYTTRDFAMGLDAWTERAARAATSQDAVDAALLEAAKAFAKAHIACDEMEAVDDVDAAAISDEEYETTTAAYNTTKAALVKAYRAAMQAHGANNG